MDGRAWLQYGGVGRGGGTITVNVNSFVALYRRGVNEATDGRSYPTTKFRLTALGREYVEKHFPDKVGAAEG